MRELGAGSVDAEFGAASDAILAIDLFVVPTASFQPLCGLLIVGLGRRQILWLGVTSHPTAEWIANQLTETT